MSLKLNRKLLVSLLLIGGIIVLAIYINLNLPEIKRELKQYPVEDFEPEAPLSEDFMVEDFGDIKPGIITNLEFSPDGSKAILLNTEGLFITDNQGKILKEVDKDISNAKFNTNNQIYYQKISGEYGIYLYSIEEGTKKNFARSADEEYFKNLSFIDESKYFFIEPKTGKYGYGHIDSGKIDYQGQKVLNQPGILENDSAAYIKSTLSEDKKLLIIIERTLTDGKQEDFLKVFPSNETSFEKPLVQTKIAPDFNGDYEFSMNDKYLTIGKDALTLDLDEKKVVYKGAEDKITFIKYSPDKLKRIVCGGDLQSKECTVEPSSQNVSLPENISYAEWLDNNTLILVVGQSLYSYNLDEKKLSKVSEESGNYKIIGKNLLNNSLIVMLNGQIKEIKFKS